MSAMAMIPQQGIPGNVRRIIPKMVLELRTILEDDFRKQLAALGIREGGIQASPSSRALSPTEQRTLDIATAAIERDKRSGASHAEALSCYIRESAFTFLNRVIGLRCIEERGLLFVDGHSETVIKVDPARNASSLYWRVRNDLPGNTNPRDVWRESLRRAFTALSQQIRVLFDIDSEYAVLFPLQPTIQRIIDVLNGPGIPSAMYAQDEFLGWVYQYYNAREKDAVYAKLGKGSKIEQPEELAAATCLYTERYMVDYLLQNTLGALWVEMHPDSELPGRWPYYVRPPEGSPRVERDTRPLREITLIDPACGSGHFLIRAFDMLVDMYREEEHEPEAEIPQLILDRNLYGVDIDLRAIQIAALGLYLKGRSIAGPSFRPRRLNLVPADAILPDEAPPEQYIARFKGDRELENLVNGIWQGLKNVRKFGSLIHPEKTIDKVVKERRAQEKGQFWERTDADWQLWKDELLCSLREEFEKQSQNDDLGQRLFGKEAAKSVGLVRVLGQKYDVVVTNPPYAGSGNLNIGLKQFLELDYAVSKRDVFTAFIMRCQDFCKPCGRVGMVTQQSWMFLRSFAALRKTVLERTTLDTVVHLGSGAFEEISGEVVSIVLFTLRTKPPQTLHHLVAFRLITVREPSEKARLLRETAMGSRSSIITTPKQSDFLGIAGTPFAYWLTDELLTIMKRKDYLQSVAVGKHGLSTADNERFLRYTWEIRPDPNVWFPHAKGGGYARWNGLDLFNVNWASNGHEIKELAKQRYPYLGDNLGLVISDESYYKLSGVTYAMMARGSLGARYIGVNVFGHKGPPIFPKQSSQLTLWSLMGLLNSRMASFLLRVSSQSSDFSVGYVMTLPLPSPNPEEWTWDRVSEICYQLKSRLISQVVQERAFVGTLRETSNDIDISEATQALLATCESIVEKEVAESYGIATETIQLIYSETGSPAGWHPLISGYDTVPTHWQGFALPKEFSAQIQNQMRRNSTSEELTQIKARLRSLYQAGARTTTQDNADLAGEEVTQEIAEGAYMPIPTESLLEEISQRLEIHPISIYWLLREMREQDGLVCPHELRLELEDYVSVSLIRMLGYRWPEQDAYEQEHEPILDSELVDEDGIIPLVRCADEATAEERIRMRLERDFGEQGATQSEQEFRKWVGKSIGEWLRKDFFRHHIQQFKQRPIAWHFVSPERTFEAFVLYHKLSLATLQKLRAQYAGNLVARLRAELERARQSRNDARVRELQLQIEDVEEFRNRIEAIERGSELKYRIRCRWKGEEENGRPGNYAPDIDDGVKVNIRPFQEAGVLAVKEVIKKW